MTTLANALTQAAATIHRVPADFTITNYSDPIDILEDKLGDQAVLHSRVLDSMAWMLDSTCISQARTVLFERYKEVDHDSPDAFPDFCQAIAEDLAHDSLYEGEESPEQTLAILLALRHQWHDAAANAAARDDRDYRSKTLRQLMEDEKPQKANVGTRINYAALADMEAKGDAAKAARLLESYMAADAINAAARAEGNKTLMPTLLEVLRAAQRYAPANARFEQLPLTIQRRLTVFALGAIDRSKVDVARRLAKQPIAFGHAAEAAFQANEALNKVIKKRFSDIGELEYAGMPQKVDDSRREQKRVACLID